jgi:hypothetical protein
VPGVLNERHPTEAGQLMVTVPRGVLAALLTMTLAAPPCYAHAQSTTADASQALHDLRGLDELRTLFDHDRDKVRIVLLLSPT